MTIPKLIEICIEKICEEYTFDEISLFLHCEREANKNTKQEKRLQKMFSRCLSCNQYVPNKNLSRFGCNICTNCWWNENNSQYNAAFIS